MSQKKNFWTRDHALHLLADIVVRTPQQLHEMGNSAGVHHSLQDYYVCEQVKSMISSPKIYKSVFSGTPCRKSPPASALRYTLYAHSAL